MSFPTGELPPKPVFDPNLDTSRAQEKFKDEIHLWYNKDYWLWVHSLPPHTRQLLLAHEAKEDSDYLDQWIDDQVYQAPFL